MNHQVPQYNPNVPILSHTDWASMAKQWATLRANVNIPPTVNKVEHYAYQNIPPPPPPPPTLSMPKPNMVPYNNEYQPIANHEATVPFNRTTPINHNNVSANIYEPPPHSIFEDQLSSNLNSQCETFDYNHRDRPFVNFNNTNAYRPPPVTNNFTQNMFNLPPPTHQDYVEPQPLKPTFVPDSAPAKLFPIMNNNDYDLVKSQPVIPTSTMPLPIKHHSINKYTNRSNLPPTRSNKGLPKWIIDDMKKIKEKERKQPFALMDDYRGHSVNSKRDEEGDIVMEDDQILKDSEVDGVLSGKSVITANRIDSVATEVDIDDVNLIDEDEGVDKLDYSSKSLVDLIEMLDEAELDNLKIAIIRDSLTGVMKQVTDEMIVETVNFTFSQELESTLNSSKTKAVKNLTRDSKTVNCNSDPTVKPIDPPAINTTNEHMCYLLGLDAYESDDDSPVILETPNDTIPDLKNVDSTTDKTVPPAPEGGRERWSSHRKSSLEEHSKSSDKPKPSSSTSAAPTKSSSSSTQSKDHHVSTSSPPETKSRHRNRSKSRERSRRNSKSRDRHRKRSRSKDRKHKSKKHDHSNASEYGNDSYRNHSNNSSMSNGNSDSGVGARWKNDKCDSAAVSRKHGKRDRSRS